jgi:CO/xanthine dehydrogenase Mo-binding subunit
VGQGTFSFAYVDDLPGELEPGIPHHIFCYGAQVAAVEVDRELGTVQVKHMVAIHDLGRAINPPAAQGQIEGGLGQGIGYALYVQLRRREDGTWIDGFAEYLLPTALGTPDIAVELIECPEDSGPFAAKSTREQGTVATASAIVNAIAAATGVRVTRLPVEPEELVRRTDPPG